MENQYNQLMALEKKGQSTFILWNPGKKNFLQIGTFLILVVCLGIFLRFHNLANLYIFGFDEEYQATYAMTLVKDPHPIWIGVSASFLDYYLGPYFTYLTAFLLWISSGNPLFTGYIASVIGVVTSIILFFAGWRFFNLTTGVVALLLYTGLPLIVFYDQKYWNPMFVPLIELLMFISLMLVKKSPWWWLFYSALVGAIFETELAPLPLVIIGAWLFLRGKYFLNKRLVLSCFLVFFLFYWPLVVFDYFHNWSNLTVLSRYSDQAEKSNASFDPKSKIASFFDYMGRFWYLKPKVPNADELNIHCNPLSIKKEIKFADSFTERSVASPWLSGLSLVLLLIFIIFSIKERKNSYHLLRYFLLITLGSYIIYTGASLDYHLNGFIVFFTLIPGIIISKMNNKLKVASFALLLFIFVIGINTVLTSSDKFSLGSKRKLIGDVMKVVGDSNFSIDGMGICHNYEGWRYLFKLYGRVPTASYTDHNLGWLYPEEIKNDVVIYAVILSESRVPPDKDVSGYNKIDEGGYSAYIKKIR